VALDHGGLEAQDLSVVDAQTLSPFGGHERIIPLRRASVIRFFAVNGGYPKGERKKEMIEMGEHIDEAKGRTKEAAGDSTDDENLKREGRIDRAVSSIKEGRSTTPPTR